MYIYIYLYTIYIHIYMILFICIMHIYICIYYIYVCICAYIFLFIIYINIYIVTSIDESAYRAYLGGGEEAARSKCISPRLFFLGMPLVADPGHWHNFAHNIDVRSRKIPPPRHFLREKGWGQNTISLLVRIAPLYYTGAGGGAVKVVCTYKIFVHLHLCKNLFRD